MRPGRAFVLALVVAATGCAPDDIATTSCTSEMLAIGDPWNCTVYGDRVGRASSIRTL